jgi:hypothetical protein
MVAELVPWALTTAGIDAEIKNATRIRRRDA